MMDDPTAVVEAGAFAELLDQRRFDLTKPPPKPVPRYLLLGKVISTPANLCAIQAPVKAGKSAFIGAMIASTMEPTGDCLGLESSNPDGLAVIHFDTEQSPYDHYQCIIRALRRAGNSEPPEWFRSYCLTDVSTEKRRQVLRFEMERAKAKHCGIHSVIIDGVGDICINVNDPAEAVSIVDELHLLAIGFYCTVVPVLHENPGSDIGKTRGHLGSQLERKAETNLRLSKDSTGITTGYSEKSRGAHIPKDRGIRFAFDEKLAMHVTIAAAAPPVGRPPSIDYDEVLAILAKEPLTFSEWAAQAKEHAGVGLTSFKKVRKHLLMDGKVCHSPITGKYEQTVSTIASAA
jgi:hypothetical protein